jgi:hypothetical protein
MNTFSESVLRGMTNEELLREQPSELLCKILMERVDEPEEDEQEEGGTWKGCWRKSMNFSRTPVNP